ncbi:unnamed protein product [Prorocentrum cordatum]|uniref:Uncharacterized protein n=1 Tax=Prorocentrum cordatum TaxID=2364126 RepID=A0ABN9V9K6_9DINO|nr:unnamed protein product [Polarella glacialis]
MTSRIQPMLAKERPRRGPHDQGRPSRRTPGAFASPRDRKNTRSGCEAGPRQRAATCGGPRCEREARRRRSEAPGQEEEKEEAEEEEGQHQEEERKATSLGARVVSERAPRRRRGSPSGWLGGPNARSVGQKKVTRWLLPSWS